MNSPLLVDDARLGPAGSLPLGPRAPLEVPSGPGPRGPLADALRASLVPSSVQELGRRGYRDVKVLPRDAVERMIAEAAERIFADRWASVVDALERAQRELAAEREEREALDLWRADAVRRLEEADARLAQANSRLADARAGFEAQLAAVLADPLAFAGVTSKRAQARERTKKAVKRLARENRELKARFEEQVREAAAAAAASPLASPSAIASAPATPSRDRRGTGAADRIARLSFGFGNPRNEHGFLAPPPPPPPPPPPVPAIEIAADLLPQAPGLRPPAALMRRLDSIEAKLETLLARADGAFDDGIPSQFRDGKRSTLRAGDPQYREKSSILKRLLEDNVRLQKGPATTTTT